MRYPRVYIPLTRLRLGPEAPIVRKGTEILITGYPRSANTFSANAFKMAQSRPVKVAHHFHVPALVVAAARRNIPTVILIRKPEQAVVSYAVHAPEVTVKRALKNYIHLYSAILPYRDHFLVATFESVTSDFGAVIRRVNERFSTSFDEFRHTEENVKKCFRLVEEDNRRASGRGKVVEMLVPRPSAVRAPAKAKVRNHYYAPNLAKLRARADGLYREFL